MVAMLKSFYRVAPWACKHLRYRAVVGFRVMWGVGYACGLRPYPRFRNRGLNGWDDRVAVADFILPWEV